jgi:hypothetical protein
MLSKFDDYPIHQTQDPIAQPGTGDRNFYDRYWFNGFDKDGEFYFGIALAVYPNRRIMDAAFSIVRDGQQHSLHASRIAPQERTDTQVGPLRIEVVEPMKRIRVQVAENETGISADLEFVARTSAIEEPRVPMRRDGRIMMDTTRFTQFGSWQGQVRADGILTEVRPERTNATRDRSWGVRPIGEPQQGPPPPAGGGGGIFFLWNPVQFDDICTHLLTFDLPDGRPTERAGMIVPTHDGSLPGVEDPAIEHVRFVEHRVVYEPGTRRAQSAELEFETSAGETQVIQLEPLLRFQMKGIGYTNREWGHGYWKGDNALGAESWKIDDLDPLDLPNMHIQSVMRARLGDRQGAGVLEQLCIGPYAPYGFKELIDGAR